MLTVSHSDEALDIPHGAKCNVTSSCHGIVGQQPWGWGCHQSRSISIEVKAQPSSISTTSVFAARLRSALHRSHFYYQHRSHTAVLNRSSSSRRLFTRLLLNVRTIRVRVDRLFKGNGLTSTGRRSSTTAVHCM
ncbi:hypothetical protein J6590_033452 [Homalodisca vitripennis]|nr:hypothetical protein J6590_033452 [Homalodisca vitripennis]